MGPYEGEVAPEYAALLRERLPLPPDPEFSLALFMVNIGLLLRPLGKG